MRARIIQENELKGRAIRIHRSSAGGGELWLSRAIRPINAFITITLCMKIPGRQSSHAMTEVMIRTFIGKLTFG